MKQPTIEWRPEMNGWCVFDPKGNKLEAFQRHMEAVDYAKSWMEEQRKASESIAQSLNEKMEF